MDVNDESQVECFEQAVFARPAVGGDLEEMTLLQLKRELLAGAGGLGESVEVEDF